MTGKRSTNIRTRPKTSTPRGRGSSPGTGATHTPSYSRRRSPLPLRHRSLESIDRDEEQQTEQAHREDPGIQVDVRELHPAVHDEVAESDAGEEGLSEEEHCDRSRRSNAHRGEQPGEDRGPDHVAKTVPARPAERVDGQQV